MEIVIPYLILAIFFGGAIGTLFLMRWTQLRVRSVHRKSLPPPKIVHSSENEDLQAYPRRLERLEGQLGERIEAVEEQEQVIVARLGDLAVKEGRQDLAKKYQQDVQLLTRRSQSMRRVLGQVWKTRSILLLRVHLAMTARQKPQLLLPEKPEKVEPRRVSASFHTAAASVRQYQQEVEQRRMNLGSVLPLAPPLATLEGLPMVVEQERLHTNRAYQELADQMDQLADNLTWLGDHFATLAVVAESPEGLPASEAANLLEEVERALDELDRLAGSVDPGTVEQAVEHIAQDISRLEVAGQEVSAEADASLEVENLLKRTAG